MDGGVPQVRENNARAIRLMLVTTRVSAPNSVAGPQSPARLLYVGTVIQLRRPRLYESAVPKKLLTSQKSKLV